MSARRTRRPALPVRRNPDRSDVVLVLMLFGGVILAAGVLQQQNPGQSPGQLIGSQVGQQIGQAAGGAATGVVGGVAESVLLGPGFDMCKAIADWRAIGSPAWCAVAGFPIIPNVCFGGGDPRNWDNFRNYLRIGGWWDPGPKPPACW